MISRLTIYNLKPLHVPADADGPRVRLKHEHEHELDGQIEPDPVQD